MDEPWIKLHFKLQDSEVWQSEKFTKGQAWVDMLLMAKHEDNMFLLRGNEVHVKWGQFAKAENLLAKKWGWSREKVRRFQEWLKTRQQITVDKSHIISIVTITNYPKYQHNETTNETTEKQQKNNRKPQKSITKNKEYTLEFEKFYEKYPHKKSKAAAFQAWQKNEKPSLGIILQAIENQIKEKKYLRSMPGRFCPEWKYPATWLNQKCWEDTVETSKREVSSFKPIPGHDQEAIAETKARLAKLTNNIGKEMP